MGRWSGGRLKPGTAESVVKKEGDDELVRSSYMPKLEEISNISPSKR